MSTLDKEKADLKRAEDDLIDAEHRVGRQALLIAKLHEHGHDTAEAQKLLDSMQRTAGLFRDHRELILEHLTRLEGKQDRSGED